MTTFFDALRETTNYTRTENGALTNKSTLDPALDYFSLGGAMRGRAEAAADLFEKAFASDYLTAVRTLFYFRDIRGGQGEREIFRAGLKRLDGLVGPESSAWLNLLSLVPEYGRWDDLLSLGVRADTVTVIQRQLHQDKLALAAGEPVSLLAKWLPSENTSSPRTKALAKQLRKALGWDSRTYRWVLSQLRARIRLLEQDMSSNNWEGIDFGKLPGQAHRKHVKAFKRHTPEAYQAYLDSVEKGEAKINVSTVFPYELYQMCQNGNYFYGGVSFVPNAYADVAWANLPDYTGGKDALVMADTSLSMTWENSAMAMAVAVSLAVYFAERNEGIFKDHFMTFSSQPSFVKVHGAKIHQRFANVIKDANVGGSTNLQAAFRAILAAALQSGQAPPAVLYVISDMEFDQATGRTDQTVFRSAKAEFASAGLELPHVVFWNVNARNMQAPATVFDGAVSLVSGSSPQVFSMAVEGKSPRELMDSVVNGPRYQQITL